MKIAEIIAVVQGAAALALQEDWDNSGLLTGNAGWECSGVLCTLDVTEAVVAEAAAKGCNLVVAHHPIIFKGLKRVTGKSYIEAVVIAAIKADVAIYAAHTSLDNVLAGVNGKIAEKLGLQNLKILSPKTQVLRRLITFVPHANAEAVRAALFATGAGQVGNYSEASFNSEGTGTFKAETGAKPFVGDLGKRHEEPETRIEVLFPAYLERQVLAAMHSAHPYEEVAYDILKLENTVSQIGSGVIGELRESISESDFLKQLQNIFKTPCLRHTELTGRPVKTVALCGGSGAFLTKTALAQGADFYITSDIKYHEFFDAEGRMVVADVGHYESEQYTIDLLHDLIAQKFPTFAVLKTGVTTNPVRYYM